MDENQNNDQNMGTDAGVPAGDMNGDQETAAEAQETGDAEGNENEAAA